MRVSHGTVAGVLLAASLTISPVSAQSLLGIIGSGDDDALITLDSGSASSNGLVNVGVGVGVGGDDGNLIDLNVLPNTGGSVVDANVSTGGDNALGVDASVLGSTVTGSVGIGGNDSLLDVDVGIGGGETGGGDIDGGDGDGGGGTAPVTPAPPANAGNTAGSGGNFASSCAGQDAIGLIRLISGADYSRQATMWQNARGVEVVPVRYCQDIVRQLRNLAMASNLGFVQSLLSNDMLVSAALNRSGKRIGDVLAVQYADRMLTVFVL